MQDLYFLSTFALDIVLLLFLDFRNMLDHYFLSTFAVVEHNYEESHVRQARLDLFIAFIIWLRMYAIRYSWLSVNLKYVQPGSLIV